MTEYTKGPWFARGDGYQAWTFDGGFNGRIMSADEQIIYAGPSSFKSLRGMTEKEALANAHLIAAAPELFELLKESQETIGGDWRERRDKILDKAAGKP